MGYFPRPAAPKTLWADLKAYVADQGRFKLAGAVVAVGMTSAMITLFIVESKWGVLPEGPQIVYAENYTPARSDDDIRRDQQADAARRHAAQEAKRAAFQRVANTLGIK